jgi:hypothetical protein
VRGNGGGSAFAVQRLERYFFDHDRLLMRADCPRRCGLGSPDDIRVRFHHAGGRVIGFDQTTRDRQMLASERTE